ncbi:MAG: DNA methyltransferase [Kiritimatiellales bacterium]
MAGRKKAPAKKKVETLSYPDDKRKNIPTAEYQAMVEKEQADPLRVAYERRNRDLDPQLVWRDKDIRDWSDFIVPAPPLYIQEKIHPKVLIDDLRKMTGDSDRLANDTEQLDMFSDFNGIPEGAEKTEFYQHDQNWSNRMILGDSLQVMASLAERESLRGKVQCIYFDPPYGIKFNSNFQWSTTSRDVKDGKVDHITREPEQVKAFRDTWRDGIHSYLSYLRDRLTVARDLLTDSGSIFVQIGDENVHRVRAVMDEVFGEDDFVSIISYSTTSSFEASTLSRAGDYIIWYAKKKEFIKYRMLLRLKEFGGEGSSAYSRIENEFGERCSISDFEKKYEITFDYSRRCNISQHCRVHALDNVTSQGIAKEKQIFEFEGKPYEPGGTNHWKANYPLGLTRSDRTNLEEIKYM